MTKEAGHGLGEYMSAAGRGMNIGSQGSILRNPLGALKGAVKGVVGHFTQNELAAGKADGVSFKQDEYGRFRGVDKLQTAKNYGGQLWDQAKNWLGQHKGLIGGIGAGVGGLMLLRHFMKPKPLQPQYGPVMQQPMPQVIVPQGLYKGAQTLYKAAGGGFNPLAMTTPTGMAGMLANGISIPGIPPSEDEQLVPEMLPPYNPNISTADPRLQKLVQSPKMRAYLKRLIEQQQNG